MCILSVITVDVMTRTRTYYTSRGDITVRLLATTISQSHFHTLIIFICLFNLIYYTDFIFCVTELVLGRIIILCLQCSNIRIQPSDNT